VARDYLIKIKLFDKLFKASCYGFLAKNSPVHFGGAVELSALSDDSKLFLIMCTIFENVWHHKLPSEFLFLRVFITLRSMGF